MSALETAVLKALPTIKAMKVSCALRVRLRLRIWYRRTVLLEAGHSARRAAPRRAQGWLKPRRLYSGLLADW